MIANALFAAAILVMAVLFLLAGSLRFLVPYRYLIIHHYAPAIGLYLGVLFLNVSALVFTLGRRFFLKDTGRKLAHFDRELNAGETPMPAQLDREESN
ncbi:MAG TPA: hypothetical protein VFA13_10690 [Candidatus Acidoferrum sp.]|nr:hypothetical protein [Candidatus Acidoferrum sp.]